MNEDQIYDAVARGNFVSPSWHEVRIERFDHRLSLWVAGDVLAIGIDNPTRVTVSPRLAQQISDRLGLAPLTARIDDLIDDAADVKLSFLTQPSDPRERARQHYSPSMSDWDATVLQSSRVDSMLLGKHSLFSSGAYKCWVAARKQVIGRSPNYGGRAPWARNKCVTPGSRLVVQPRVWFHSTAHHDYSQGLRMVVDYCEVDGRAMTVRELAAHPDLWVLISDEGPIGRLSYLPTASGTVTPGSRVSIILRRGSTGQDVMMWQRVVGTDQDGVFGQDTEHRTKIWQAQRGLYHDGVVGPKTWAMAGFLFKRPQRSLPGVDPRSAACVAALRDANEAWPLRSRASDGIMGDPSHRARKSDHNLGNAVDITHDPGSGCDAGEIAKMAIHDDRVTYVIFDRRIYNRARAAEGWRPYSGSNPHTHHVHISVRVDRRDDSGKWAWSPKV